MARSWWERGAPALGVVLAWLLPVLWLVAVLGDRPSDGTVVSSPDSLLAGERWEDGVVVREAYGDTGLLAGDLIEAVGRRDAATLLEGGGSGPTVRVGESLPYRVLRTRDPLPIEQTVEVPLAAHPVLDAGRRHPGRVVVAVALLAAGSLLVLRLPRSAVAWATLATGVGAGVGLASVPVGAQAVDLASPGLFMAPVAGEAALVLALGAGVGAAWSFPRPPQGRGRGGSVAGRVALALVPVLAAAVWLALWGRQSRSALLQAALGLSVPAAAVTVGIVGAALVTGFRRARSPQESVAVRLVLLALLSAGAARAVLVDVPRVLRGDPLVPADLLALVLVPMVAACWVAATLGYRLLEIDGALRRALLQVVLASVVTALFLAAAGAVGGASTTSLGTLVTGGALALVCVPVALVVRRSLSRLVYGDRAFPYRVVAELRRLDLAAADDALRETLEVLTRTLHLSYAVIETTGEEDDRLVASLGEPRGQATTVSLEVAGQPLGSLRMEVAPLRDPFGPRDRRLLEELGTQVGALVQALLVNRQLLRARERLVRAREEERRRLRRDLHDGLGPSLATMVMRLELAEELVRTDPARAATILAELAERMQAEIGEVRRLVDGLRPPALDQLGLVSALKQRAEEHAASLGAGADGADSPDRQDAGMSRWILEAPDDLGALPAAVEVAAYRIALEGVTNAVRHSGGSRCTVRLGRGDGALEVEIRDDGHGIGSDGRVGVGLGSMRERAEELGGTCTVTSVPGRGTTVLARLPVPADGGAGIGEPVTDEEEPR